MYKAPDIRTTNYPQTKRLSLDKFLGVDFTSGETLTDIRRSYDAKNMVWGDNPLQAETRTGYKQIVDIIEENKKIYGIHPYGERLYVHCGTKLYLLEESLGSFDYEPTMVYSGLTETFTSSFVMNDNLYIVGGGTYIEINEAFEVNAVDEIAFIPTVVINRSQSGGGDTYEAINLLSNWRKNSFKTDSIQNDNTITVDGIAYEFDLPTTNASDIILDSAFYSVTKNETVLVETTDYTIDFTAKTITFVALPLVTDTITAIYSTQAVEYTLTSTYIDYKDVFVIVDDVLLTEGVGYAVDRETGIVTLDTPATLSSGTDNVIITFSKSNGVTNVAEPILESDGLTTVYTLSYDAIKKDNFVVKIADVTQTEGVNYTINRLTGILTFYIAPTFQAEIEITYQTTYNDKATIINKCDIFSVFGGGNDTRVFLAGNPDLRNKDWQSGLYDPTYFPDTGYTEIGSDDTAIMGYVKQYDTQMIIKEGDAGSSSAFLRVFNIDEDGNVTFPVEQGAVGIGAISKYCFSSMQGEPLFLSKQGVIGVSGSNVDNQRLLQDRSTLVNTKLTNESELENAKGIVFNDKYYIFIQGNVYLCDARMRYQDSLGNYQYEWQFWDNVNADSVAIFDEHLLFGSYGKIYKFKKVSEPALYYDENNGVSTGIESYWTTPALYFGDIYVRKNIDFINVMLSEKSRVNVNISISINNGEWEDVEDLETNPNFNFADVDFSNISFLQASNLFSRRIRLNAKKIDNIKFRFYNSGEKASAVGVLIFQADYKPLYN